MKCKKFGSHFFSCQSLLLGTSVPNDIYIYIYIYIYTYTRCIKNSDFRKEVGIAIKSKETSSQFESVRDSYVAIMHQAVTICSTM